MLWMQSYNGTRSASPRVNASTQPRGNPGSSSGFHGVRALPEPPERPEDDWTAPSLWHSSMGECGFEKVAEGCRTPKRCCDYGWVNWFLAMMRVQGWSSKPSMSGRRRPDWRVRALNMGDRCIRHFFAGNLQSNSCACATNASPLPWRCKHYWKSNEDVVYLTDNQTLNYATRTTSTPLR